LLYFLNVFIDYLDDYEDAPISTSTRGGRGGGAGGGGGVGRGGGAAFQNSGSSGVTGLYPCSICNRSFASDRIQQHEEACKKANKTRRTFDSTKQRLSGTEAASYFRQGKGGKGRAEPAKPQVTVIIYHDFKLKVFFVDIVLAS
jgi:hypothetical protein